MIAKRDALARTPERDLALSCLEAGLEASDPVHILNEAMSRSGPVLDVGDETIDLDAYDTVFVVGGGKAAGRQAVALEAILGEYLDGGIVITTESVETNRIEVLAGDHPVPSERGVTATRALLDRVEQADDTTLLIVPITGGGSALMTAPAEGIALEDLQSVTRALLRSGATIHEINAVRKHLSAIKGGGLSRAAAPARVVSLIMSDVVGDDLSVIASGPTVADESTYADARAILERYAIEPPAAVRDRLAAACEGNIPETPGPDDAVFDGVSNHLIADSGTAVRAAAAAARERGVEQLILSTRIRGEARESAKTHVAIAEEVLASGEPVRPPAVLVSGGETTVTVRGEGTGGPNLEFALSAALECEAGITVGAIDTDGIDGLSEVAGAVVDPATVDDPGRAQSALSNNDAGTYLDERADTIRTGPTGTNLNDLRVVVVSR